MAFDWERFWESSKDAQINLTCPCAQGKVYVHISYEHSAVKAAFGVKASETLVAVDAGPDALPKWASGVQIIVKPSDKKESQISAKLSPAECAALLGGSWPCTETFDRIARALRERRDYPLPKPEIPGGGGKSAAPGQTKKEGSHSHDRHR